jgi:two-component system cell cycle sensor histidine kinase/response regulator CckA
MNGRELANYLMDRRPRLKVLYMSGHTGQGIGQAILPTGSHFLPKPFSREHLAAKIREALQVELPAAVLEGTRLQTVEEESR